MAYHGTFHFTLLKKAWLPRPIKMMSERRLFLVKNIIFGLLRGVRHNSESRRSTVES